VGAAARRADRDRQQSPAADWINLPRLDHVLPVVAGVGAALLLFFFQKDLGPALLLSLMFLSLFAIARGGAWLAGAGFATLVAGFGVGYLLNISNTLAARLEMWRAPWDNAVRGGDQIAQASGDWPPERWPARAPGWGTRGSCLRDTPIWFSRPSAKSLGFVGLLAVGAAFRSSRGGVPNRQAWIERLPILPRARAHAVACEFPYS
jgi:hypothetical protein